MNLETVIATAKGIGSAVMFAMKALKFGTLRITIDAPTDGQSVPLKREVRGTVYPPLSKVQVLVLANNNLWYAQPEPVVDGTTWSVTCQFGNADSRKGSQYSIVALDGTARFEGTIKNLPTTIKQSRIVKVSRQ
jgi:hypothetical protein